MQRRERLAPLLRVDSPSNAEDKSELQALT